MSEIIYYASLSELWEAFAVHAYGPPDERPQRDYHVPLPDINEREVLRWHPVGTLIAWPGVRAAIVFEDGWLVDGKWISTIRPQHLRHRYDPIEDFVEELPGLFFHN
jgi:hypothetical protein